jgi:hypothetical protein
MRLAVARGARHYASVYPPAESDPGVEAISHEDLVALLLLGAQPFEPFALRCAAQIISLCDLRRLSLIAAPGARQPPARAYRPRRSRP